MGRYGHKRRRQVVVHYISKMILIALLRTPESLTVQTMI